MLKRKCERELFASRKKQKITFWLPLEVWKEVLYLLDDYDLLLVGQCGRTFFNLAIPILVNNLRNHPVRRLEVEDSLNVSPVPTKEYVDAVGRLLYNTLYMHPSFRKLFEVFNTLVPYLNTPLHHAARNGSFTLFAYYHEEKKMELTPRVSFWAALYGHLDFLKMLASKHCHIDTITVDAAAFGGHTEVLKYLFTNTGIKISECNHACSFAALGDHLETLKYLHEINAPWSSEVYRFASAGGSLSCVEYAWQQDCPVDPEDVHTALNIAKKKENQQMIKILEQLRRSSLFEL